MIQSCKFCVDQNISAINIREGLRKCALLWGKSVGRERETDSNVRIDNKVEEILSHEKTKNIDI